MLEKVTDAKLLSLACATMALLAPCFEKNFMSSVSSKSEGSPAKTSLSPNAWHGNRKFGRYPGRSSLLVLGKSRVKQPKTVPCGRVVEDKHTILAKGSDGLTDSCPILLSASKLDVWNKT